MPWNSFGPREAAHDCSRGDGRGYTAVIRVLSAFSEGRLRLSGRRIELRATVTDREGRQGVGTANLVFRGQCAPTDCSANLFNEACEPSTFACLGTLVLHCNEAGQYDLSRRCRNGLTCRMDADGYALCLLPEGE